MKKKAILVVSYGSSHREAMEKSIGAIEKRIQEEFQEYKIYRAFTGKRVVKKLKNEGVLVMTLTEALEKLKEDGIQELIVRPAYVTDGMENEKMIQEVRAVGEGFEQIAMGTPLLNSMEDCKELAQIIIEDCPVKENEILMFMGHGTSGGINLMYLKLQDIFEDMGYQNIVVGTMKGHPSFEEVIKLRKKLLGKKVILQPLMIVAGEHARKDMAGKEDSWKSKLEEKGYQVECHIKGLGEFEGVQEMFIRHIEQIISEK